MKSFGIILLNILLSISIPAQDNHIQMIQKDIQEIENIVKATKDLHGSLIEVKGQVDELASTARDHQFDNMLKTYLKGMIDVYNLLYDGPSTAIDFLIEALTNLYLEPEFTKARTVKVDTEQLKIKQNNYTSELNNMYKTLGEIIRSDLSRFDDDKPAFAYTSTNWRNADGIPDDESELITRKLFVTIGLCEKLSVKIDSTCTKLRGDFIQWNKALDENKNLLRVAEVEAKENQRIRDRQQLRMEQFRNAEKNSEDLRKYEEVQKTTELQGKEITDERLKESLLLMKEKEAENKLLKAGYELGKSARVSFELTSSNPLYAGYLASFTAEINPPGAFGELLWEVDDMVVGHVEIKSEQQYKTNFSQVFLNPGIHDVSVSFLVIGEFIDKHLTQVKVEEEPNKKESYEKSLLLNNFGTPPYNTPPKKIKRNDRIQIVDLPYSKYWVSGSEGQEVIDGFYFNLRGERKEYRSLKILGYKSVNPVYGLFALTSLNGYHVYRTMENNNPHLIITFLSANGPTEKENISNVSEFEVTIAPDYSKAEVKYKPIQGVSKTIELK